MLILFLILIVLALVILIANIAIVSPGLSLCCRAPGRVLYHMGGRLPSQNAVCHARRQKSLPPQGAGRWTLSPSL